MLGYLWFGKFVCWFVIVCIRWRSGLCGCMVVWLTVCFFVVLEANILTI